MKPTRALRLPRLELLYVGWRGQTFSLPVLLRRGAVDKPALLLVHGLGGAKENFHHAFQSPALADCTLVTFDAPGTGLAEFQPETGLDLAGLADLTQAVADQLLPGPYFLVGASMGGLISLLMIRRHGRDRIQGFINLEGNLAPEDCMFSRRAVRHSLEDFQRAVFPRMMEELQLSRYVGDQIIAQNMALNLDVRAYHTYSFDAVAESDSGELLEEFLRLSMPRLFLYGSANRGLSYLPRLRASEVEVKEIPRAAHFLFYDNPVATFQAVGDFVQARSRAASQ